MDVEKCVNPTTMFKFWIVQNTHKSCGEPEKVEWYWYFF